MAWTVSANIKGPTGSTGPSGPTGPTGAAGAVGPAGLTWRGAWSNANTYAINDSVTWGGSSYYATVAKAAGLAPPTGTASNPGADDTAVNAGWALLAIQGATGLTGPTGAQGATGPAGAAGATGATGATGSAGAAGTRGSRWYVGSGAPGTIADALPNDQYLDSASGAVYTLS